MVSSSKNYTRSMSEDKNNKNLANLEPNKQMKVIFDVWIWHNLFEGMFSVNTLILFYS